MAVTVHSRGNCIRRTLCSSSALSSVPKPFTLGAERRGGSNKVNRANYQRLPEPRTQTLTYGKHVFRNKFDALAYFRGLLSSYKWNNKFPVIVTSVEDFDTLKDLLGDHPDAEEKIGCGVQCFVVQETGLRSVCFWVKRLDGTLEDFSIRKCLRLPYSSCFVQDAFRNAVQEDLEYYKRTAAKGGVLTCSVTGMVVPYDDLCVDYEMLGFYTLFLRFVEQEGLSVFEILKTLEEGPNSTPMLGVELQRRWLEYHRTNAQLRLVSRQVLYAKKQKKQWQRTYKQWGPP